MNSSPLSVIAAVQLVGAFLGFVIIGIATTLYFYKRLGYPPIPRYLRISLRRSLDEVRNELASAFADGFRLTKDSDGEITVEKTFANPAATISARYLRTADWVPPMNFIKVTCVGRPWLNRGETTSSNFAGISARKRKRRQAKAEAEQRAEHVRSSAARVLR